MDEYKLVKALGRSVHFGSFYDARTEQVITGINLFNVTKLPVNIIESIDNTKCTFTFIKENSFQEKLLKFDTNVSLKLSIVAGMVDLSGTAKFLYDNMESKRSDKCTLNYEIKTKHESFSLSNLEIKKHVSMETLTNAVNATHVVVGINWGANVTAEITIENSDTKTSKEIKGSIEALGGKAITLFEKSLLNKNTNLAADYSSNTNVLTNKLNVKFEADVISDGPLPQDIPQILEFIAKIKEYLKNSNDGKGVQLEFDLYPVQEIKKFFKMDLNIERKLKIIYSTIVFELVSEFDNFIKQKQELNDLVMEATYFQKHFSKSKLDDLKDKKNKVDLFELIVKDNLKIALVAVRSGLEDKSKLIEIMESLLKEISSIKEFINDNIILKEKCMEMKDYESDLGIEYFFGSLLNYRFSGYILFYTGESDENLMNENIELLRLLQLLDKNNKFYFCDLDANEQLKKTLKLQINEICFQQYLKGRCLENDLYSSKK